MLNNKKAIFIDIDGTLYDSSIKDFRPTTIEILKQLANNPDYDLYIASGRSLSTIGSVKKYFNNFKGFVLTNGEEIYIDDKKIYQGKISSTILERFVKYCNKNNYPIVLICEDHLYYNQLNQEMKTNFEEYIKVEIEPLQDMNILSTISVSQLWLFVSNEENEKIRHDFPELEVINWGNYGADVLEKNHTKGEGVTRVINLMGYKLENTFAIGDSDNDVVMFTRVGTSICMGNGTTKAKNAAKIVGYDISDEGLMKNIKEYILKEKMN